MHKYIFKLNKLIMMASLIGVMLCLIFCQTDSPQNNPGTVTDTCNVMDQDCSGSNEMCNWGDAEDAWVCMPEGSTVTGGACEKSSECKKSNICINDGLSMSCRTLCDDNSPCSTGSCVMLEDGSGLGVCIP